MKAFFICLEGLDQAGKKSITKILAIKLREIGYDAEVISFPDYATPIGKEISKFLQGKRSYIPEVRQFLYVANRFERKHDVERWLKTGKIVIADRYTPSGLAYGLANGLDIDWMINLERGLPQANITILIDVQAQVAYQREKEKDVYERDIRFQEKVRAAYLNLAERFKWVVINGERTLDDVTKSAWNILLKSIEEND